MKPYFSIPVFLVFLFSLSRVSAGIVEMPEIEESTSLHGASVYENYNIPSARYRNMDPQSGPRLWVKEIRLQGIGDYPELGIFRKEISEHIEKRRQQIMREDKLRAHGYTDEEIAEILDLLNKMDDRLNYQHATEVDLQKFIWLVREQKERRGLTLGQIENLAFEVEEYYREKGMGLVKAFVPRQAMRDGVLIITVLNGKLGEVNISNNALYSDTVIRSVFDDIMYKPVKFDIIEEHMYRLNDYPGLAISGTFEAGDQIGDTRLNLNVIQEKEFDHTLRLDNHGAESTGENRGFYQFYWNNPARVGDQISLALLKSTSPDNSVYGLLGYRLPLWNHQLFANFSLSSNQFAIDQSTAGSSSINQLGIIGETRLAEVTLDYALKRSREESWWLNLIYNTTETTLDSKEFGNLGLDDKIRNLRLLARFDLLNNEDRVLHLGSLGLTSGEFEYGESIGQDKAYYIFNTDYSRLSFMTIPWTDIVTRLILKMDIQYTDTALPAAEQSALGGPTAVRAFQINQFTGDSTAYIGIEWVFNTPDWLMLDYFSLRNIAQKMQPFFFANTSRGVQYALLQEEDKKATLSDVGVGFQYAYGRSINGNLQFAFPVTSQFSDESVAVPTDKMRVVFDFQYRF